ncbi:MAG: sel1 repeat family protein [Acidobacteriia bacterium]|nr:sel1 repeat family protein [Terriglobia bacterium]
MTKNESNIVLANKIAGRISLAILAVFLWMASSRPALAVDHATNAGLDQCSLAIVTRQPVGSVRICDPKTVRSLAQHGQVFEQNQMGMVSMLVVGPGYDPAQALKWFEQAARKGYAPAQVNLAVMYINGWGTQTNYGTALHWLHEAANQNYARADYNLGILYQQGQGVTKDPAEALRYFRKGAEAGDTGAQTNLGYFYDRGLGVPRNLQTAADWYRKAADAGVALAQNNLADLYLRGEGVPQDDAAAFRLFQQAASQGQTGARIKLGYMYSAGRGTPKDLATAYTWITAATIAGDARGRDLLRSIESQLTPAQIAEGHERAKKLNAEGAFTVLARALQP